MSSFYLYVVYLAYRIYTSETQQLISYLVYLKEKKVESSPAVIYFKGWSRSERGDGPVNDGRVYVKRLCSRIKYVDETKPCCVCRV